MKTTAAVIGRGVGPVALSVALLAASTHAATLPDWAEAQSGPQAIFKAGVEVVTVSVGVRDNRGRVVQNLKRTDFDVIDSGALIAIKDFYTGESPVSLGVLLDISGSMAVSGNIDRARHAVRVALENLEQGRDEAAFYTFDSKLREVAPFTKDLQWINGLNLEGKPFGTTSLFDAIAESSREVASRGNRQRALLVITDGVDTASRLSAPEVSGIASSIDVPVYLLTVVSPLNHPEGEFSVLSDSETSVGAATLADLARWTGGDMRISSVPAHTSEAVRDLFMELRHQYLITFEPGARPGWHPLEVRTKKKNLIVHARSGYMSGPGRLTN